MHSCTKNNYFSLAKEYQTYISKEHRKHGVINQENIEKISSKIKWTDREYNVQDNADVAYKDMKMYCDTNQFLKLPFFGSHPKTHGARRFSRHYRLCFDTKLDYGKCEIRRNPCSCVAHTSMFDKPWIYVIPSKK